MKKIEDYLHLYLGCDIFVPRQNQDLKDDIMRLTAAKMCGYDLSNVKPILRPLADMTEEEGALMDDMAKRQRDNYIEIQNCKFFDGIRTESAEAFAFLLSKHFDLFGLIEAGLAIDKTNQS